MSLKLILVIAVLGFVAGCAVSGRSGGNAPVDELIWVAKAYSGGEQCTATTYEPPDTEQLLEEEGIAVYATRVRPMLVCAACGCPAYAATHFARIARDQLEEARRLGFRRKPPPEVE